MGRNDSFADGLGERKIGRRGRLQVAALGDRESQAGGRMARVESVVDAVRRGVNQE